MCVLCVSPECCFPRSDLRSAVLLCSCLPCFVNKPFLLGPSTAFKNLRQNASDANSAHAPLQITPSHLDTAD